MCQNNNNNFFSKENFLNGQDNFKSCGNEQSQNNDQHPYQQQEDKGKSPMNPQPATSNLNSFPVDLSGDSSDDPEEIFTNFPPSHYFDSQLDEKESLNQQAVNQGFETENFDEYGLNSGFDLGLQDLATWNESMATFSNCPTPYLTRDEFFHLQKNFRYKQNLFNFMINDRPYRVVRLRSSSNPNVSVLYKTPMKGRKGIQKRYTLIRDEKDKEKILEVLESQNSQNLEGQEEIGTSSSHHPAVEEESVLIPDETNKEEILEVLESQNSQNLEGQEEISTSYLHHPAAEEKIASQGHRTEFVQGLDPNSSHSNSPKKPNLPTPILTGVVVVVSVSLGIALIKKIWKVYKKTFQNYFAQS